MIKNKLAIINIVVVMLFMVFGLSGCRSEYDPEADVHATLTQTDFFKVQLFDVSNFARVYDLTELGKQQEILVIPDYIEGYPVTQIGVYRSKRYGIRSDNLKKIYIPQTVYSKMYMGLPIASLIECKDEVVFLTAEKINLAINGSRIIMMPDAFERSTQGLLEDFLANLEYSSPNIIYHYNYVDSPNKDIFWLDFIMEDSLFLEPKNPKREGYIFLGWYIDKDCNEKWYGVKPTGNDKVIKLYAGWE